MLLHKAVILLQSNQLLSKGQSSPLRHNARCKTAAHSPNCSDSAKAIAAILDMPLKLMKSASVKMLSLKGFEPLHICISMQIFSVAKPLCWQT